MVTRAAEVHGFLAIDKPRGWTSHDVVARVRRLVGQRSVGHAGTLDPMATGLLPLGLGQGTRLLEFMGLGSPGGLAGADGQVGDARKRYEATLQLGAATDTYDAEGRVTETALWQHVERGAVAAALAGFTGEIEQRPPLYSAIKRGGEPLYRLARRGEQVEVPLRRVTVYALTLERFTPPELSLAVECGAGTYVRSLAHDLGLALGTRAHLTALRRTRVADLDIADAAPIDAFSTREDVLARLLALDLAARRLPALVLSEAHARDVLEGRLLPPLAAAVATRAATGLCRAYDTAGRFLALLRRDSEAAGWQPFKVLARRESVLPATD